MSQLDDLMPKYAADIKEMTGSEPDMELLKAVAKGLGPSIYNKDSSTVAASDKAELETVKNNFLVKKLGLADSDALMTSIDEVIDMYGRSKPNKLRVVVYYMLTKKHGKESVYA